MVGAVAPLERAEELDRLRTLIDRARDGDGGALLVEGEAGIGKSALLSCVEGLAGELGMRVLKARGGELEIEHAHGLVRQLFEREVSTAPPHRRERLLAGAAQLALPVVAPGLLPSAGRGAAAEAFAVQHGLYWLVSNLSEERPLVLVVDDLHWADSASGRFVAYLARRLEGTPIALVGAIRTGERSPAAAELAAALAAPAVERRVLRPLGEASVACLVEDMLGRPPGAVFARACHDVSRGNPFLLAELMRTLAAAGIEPTDERAQHVHEVGPPGVAHSVLLRLARLSPDAVALAQALAVLGTPAQLRHAAALAGLSAARAHDAADALEQARILTAGRPLDFLHPLVRTAIYRDLSAGRRSSDHKRAARLLADEGSSGDHVANHLLLAEPVGDPWVVDALATQAGEDLARGAPAAAAEHLRRALAEPAPPPRRAELLARLGWARYLTGDARGFEQVREALEAAADARMRATIARDLAPVLMVVDRVPEAIELLEDGITRLHPKDPLVASLEAVAAHVAEFDISTPSRLPPDVEDLPGATADERLLLATAGYRSSKLAAPRERGVALTRRALANGRLFDDEGVGDVERSMYAIHTLLYADEFDATRATVDQFMASVRARGSLMGYAAASFARAHLGYRLGALADADGDFREAVRAASTIGMSVPVHAGMLLVVLVERGHITEAQEVFDAAGLDEQRHLATTGIFPLFLLTGRARLRLARGDMAGGLEDLLEIGRRCQRWGQRNPAEFPWRSEAALVLGHLGERDEARRLAEDELELAQRFGAPRTIGIALLALAAVESSGDEAIALLREAEAVLAGSPALLTKAKVAVDLGAALRRANRRAQAREALREGYELAHRCEAEPLIERAEIELAAAGSRPRRVMRRGVESLTPSERRVCELAIGGLSNPEIAQSLFVTRATVESHLHAAYRKLGVASRGELARAIRATGDSPKVPGPAGAAAQTR